MLRQRLREDVSPVAVVGRVLVFLLAVALVWYGAMTVLLALKVAPATVNSISGYRSAFDWAAELTPGDVDGATTRPIIAGAGLLAFLLFGYLAWKEIPRPHLTRREVHLADDDRGGVTIEPRAIERLAETAAEQARGVSGASGRYGDDELTVTVTVRRARDLPATLRHAQQHVLDALDQHELPMSAVNVTLAQYDRRHRRELT